MLFGVAALLAGLALLLLGRVVVWRLAAGACVGGIGALAAAELAVRTNHDPLWPSAISGVCMGLIGLALARVFWAVAGGTFMAASAELALLHRMLPAKPVDTPSGFEPGGLALEQWMIEAGRTLGEWFSWMVETDPMLTLLTGTAAAVAGLVLGLVRPVAMRIFATSVAGAMLIVGGACLTITSLVGRIGLTTGHRPWILVAVGAVAAIAGMAHQVRTHSRAAKAASDDKDNEDDKK